ncbi:MAG: endonuclease MutS2 [bacterium]
MDNHSLDVLEFDAVRERLSSFACSEPGKKLCLNISPKQAKPEIEQELLEVQQTKEAVSIHGRLPLSGLMDINPYLAKSDQNGICLDLPELLEIEKFLDLVHEVIQWFSQITEAYSSLTLFGDQLIPLKALKNKLIACIDPLGNVKDSASPLLGKIRTQIRREKEKILHILEGFLKEESGQEALQGDFITLRNDRYVIPVKAGRKGMIEGIVHDESGSGATLFIEPITSVEAQNSYRRLKIKEKEEIKRIFFELSRSVSEHSEALSKNLEILTKLDFIQAKAMFSQAIEGIAPSISPEPQIRLKGARHALLIFRHMDSPNMGSEPVAIDIELDQDTRSLVISGPNTGGKTVTLKMVGLLQIMMQSGLHIPAKEGTELGIFNEVLADIGDEQDIEKDLSSFSSHIKNLTRILKNVGPSSIVLLDELGSDTNPTEGAAIGIAVLEYILKRGSLCLVTTHHNGLKAYASSHHGEVKNASMGFDSENKTPTYRLHIGYPGSSNALGIGAKLGLPAEILESARMHMGRGEVQLENLLCRLEQQEKGLTEKIDQQEKILDETRSIRERYTHLLSDLEEKEARMAKDAGSRVQAIVDNARKEIERVIAELKRSTPTSKAIKDAHQDLKAVAKRYSPSSSGDITHKGLEIEKIAVGQPVIICDLKEKGIVSRVDQEENKVWVMVGPLKFQVKADELKPAEASVHRKGRDEVSAGRRVHMSSSVSVKEVSPKLVVIGQRVDDALQNIDKYLDNAIMARFSSVSIIHGKGTGRLKKAIETFLTSHPLVASFKGGTPQEGGAGVTIVELVS